MTFMKGKQSLSSWLVEAMTDEEKGKPISAISLVHVVGEHGSEREVHAIRFGTKVWKETDLAELFMHKASSYCQDIPGSQLFMLLAYYGSSEAQARHPFRVSPPTDLGLATEPPTDVGVKQQSMRLTEALVQGAFRERALLMDNVFRNYELMSRHNERLMSEQQAMAEQMRVMIIEKATLGHEQRMAELAEEQKKQLVEKGLELLPAVVNSLTGKEVVPQETADSALIKAVAHNIKHEHVKALASVLPAEVMGPLAARLAQLLDEKEKKEAEGKRRLSLVSAEDDVVGGKDG